MFRIRLAKENFKFSCSHFTIFGPTHAENLHGHNYYVSVELSLSGLDPDLGMAFDFNLVKPILRSIADELDERVLLPEKSKYLKFKLEGPQISVKFGEKSYSFPADDTALLPVVNITSEELARHFANEFAKRLRLSQSPGVKFIRTLSVGIEETRGQTVVYDLEFS